MHFKNRTIYLLLFQSLIYITDVENHDAFSTTSGDDNDYSFQSVAENIDSIDDEEDDDDESNKDDDISRKQMFQHSLRKWDLKFRINHVPLKELLKIFNDFCGENHFLPVDPRTLLQTERNVIPVEALIGGGEYWHNGLEKCLTNVFRNLNKSISISLNVNIDGLPIFNSSKVSFS